MREPGFVRSLREELSQVRPEFQERVHRQGALPDEQLLSLVGRCEAEGPDDLQPAAPKDVAAWEDVTAVDELAGALAIKRGEVAFAVTLPDSSRPFAKLPGVGTSLLAWKLMQGADMPVWIMASPSMLHAVDHHVRSLALSPKLRGTIFTGFEGYRLTPDSRLAWLAPGVPDLHPLGDGDLGPALVEDGVLDDNPEVRWIVACDVSNVMASPHDGLIGFHTRHGSPVTCEVVGGASTGTMVIDVAVLRAEVQWRWRRVRREVMGRLVVQHERSLQQLAEGFPTVFVNVPQEARYVLARTNEELEAAGQVLAGYRVA